MYDLLLLGGHLLLDVPPRADLQATADPAQDFIAHSRGFRSTDRTLAHFFDTVRRDGAFGVLQDLGGNHRFVLDLSLASHARLNSLHTMTETTPRNNPHVR